MAYVDIQCELKLQKHQKNQTISALKSVLHLVNMVSNPNFFYPLPLAQKKSTANELLFDLQSYLELVDATGRCMHAEKEKDVIQNKLPILERVNTPPENWMKLTSEFTLVLHGSVRREQAMLISSRIRLYSDSLSPCACT